MSPACGVCGNAEANRRLAAREMMLGLQDPFEYLECSRCGSLQLLTVPDDWSRYYPSGYYAFEARQERSIKRWLKRARARHALGYRSILGSVLVRHRGVPPFVDWLGSPPPAWDARILDVGSGAGQLLRDMRDAGYSNLTGIDPYLPRDEAAGPGIRLLRRHLGDLDDTFDWIMMNHSLEHIEDPEQALREASRVLSPKGTLLVRMPVAGSFAHREYGPDWVQLDAPRHRTLFSERGVKLVAGRTGFALRSVRYDSSGFQFWGSEQYRRGIPLRDPRSYDVDPARSPFTGAELAEYERRAVLLNRERDGDQAIYLLTRP